MKKLAFFAAFLLMPTLAFAQQIGNVQALGQVFTNIINNVLVPLLLLIAFLVFIFGVFQYFILGGSDEEKRAQGQKLILYGIIGFFVMVSVWGLVNILVGTFNLNQAIPRIPTTPGVR